VLIYPNAYNIFARLGEVTYVQATTSPMPDMHKLIDAQRYFLRSVELCEDYLRGYYGLVVVTSKLLSAPVVVKLPVLSGKVKVTREIVEKFRVMAVGKLVDIVGKARRREKSWEGYNEGEVEAAGRLLEEMEGSKGAK